MKFRFVLATLILAVVTPMAFGQSTELTITGRVVPAPCRVLLGNGGVADLGDIYAKDLNPDTKTALETVTLSFSVVCESETRFALQTIDNHPDSSASQYYSGLGFTPDGEKIGEVEIGVQDYTADGAECFLTRSTNGGKDWASSGNMGTGELKLDGLLGFNKLQNDRGGPSPIASVAATLWVKARIQPADGLTLHGVVQITGSITLDLIYL